MTKTRQGEEFGIEVDGEPFVWRLQRLPHWTRDPRKARDMAIAARSQTGQREAVIEFPPGPQPRLGAPQLKASHIDPALVATAIASAMAAGWDPHSRGRTVTIVVDETGR